MAVLSSLQNQNKDELYLYQAYDVQYFYPNKLCADTFGKIVRCCLYQALSENNRLPAVIIVITGNKDVDNKVSNPYNTKRIWNSLCNEIDRAIKARKNDLPKKAFLNEEPRVFFSNMFPRSKSKCDDKDDGQDSYKTKRRRLNNILPQILQKFGFEVITINGIKPEEADYFESSTGLLSGKGMEMFWNSISKELKLADERLKEQIKNKIINSYLEERDEMERTIQERNTIRTARFGANRTFPRQNFDRGDGRDRPFQRNNIGRVRRGNSAHR